MIRPFDVRTALLTAASMLEDSGGFSLNPFTGEFYSADKPPFKSGGYAVSIRKDLERVYSFNPGADGIRSYLDAVEVGLCYGTVLGGWKDEAGNVYLDLSIVVETLEEALELARKHGQLAVWDFANSKSIPVA